MCKLIFDHWIVWYYSWASYTSPHSSDLTATNICFCCKLTAFFDGFIVNTVGLLFNGHTFSFLVIRSYKSFPFWKVKVEADLLGLKLLTLDESFPEFKGFRCIVIPYVQMCAHLSCPVVELSKFSHTCSAKTKAYQVSAVLSVASINYQSFVGLEATATHDTAQCLTVFFHLNIFASSYPSLYHTHLMHNITCGFTHVCTHTHTHAHAHTTLHMQHYTIHTRAHTHD